jgi:hypothetical protein
MKKKIYLSFGRNNDAISTTWLVSPAFGQFFFIASIFFLAGDDSVPELPPDVLETVLISPISVELRAKKKAPMMPLWELT